jgi:hypothetical protein
LFARRKLDKRIPDHSLSVTVHHYSERLEEHGLDMAFMGALDENAIVELLGHVHKDLLDHGLAKTVELVVFKQEVLKAWHAAHNLSSQSDIGFNSSGKYYIVMRLL